jgi:FkbM family methyltransferase
MIPTRLKRCKYIVGLSQKLRYSVATILSYVEPYAAFYRSLIDRIGRDLIIAYRDNVFLVPDYWSIRLFDPLDEAFVWRYMDIDRGVFIDVGAHVGKYTVIMAKKLKDAGTVLTFEPHPVNFRYLIINLSLNKVSNVLPFNMACYSCDGYLDLYIARESGLHSLVLPRSECKIRVKTCTLDSIIEKLHVDNVRLIKIDVEGAEIEVIKGAIKTIVKHHPTIIVEVQFSNIAEFVKLMFKLNYRIKALSTGPGITYIVAFPRY